jgi:phosphatidylserine decarboxylase
MNKGKDVQRDPQEIVLKEALPFIIPPVVLALVFFFLVNLVSIGLVLIVLALFFAYFFRNPSRIAPEVDGAAIAPADGKIAQISKEGDNDFLGGEVVKVSIFMSVLNVHINRMPVRGRIVDMLYKKGGFRPAFNHESSRGNEQNALIVDIDDDRRMAIVQVAGLIARRIVCWIKKGDRLERGQRFGFIRFGSRVDCYFPVGFEVDVRPGQRVRGGETILGYIR